MHDLYRKKRLLHCDISIYNIAFYKKKRGGGVVGVVLDFDLAVYPEGAARPFLENSSGPPLDSVRLARDLAVPPVDVSPSQGSIIGSDETLKNGQDRSGTAPFMAIEALDLRTPYYKHHVCHELESIFYASVWHGIGYRHKAKILPRPPCQPGSKTKPPDYLQVWRRGTWSEVKNSKMAFISSSGYLLSLIEHPELKYICVSLAFMFRERQLAAQIQQISEQRSDIDKAMKEKKRFDGMRVSPCFGFLLSFLFLSFEHIAYLGLYSSG